MGGENGNDNLISNCCYELQNSSVKNNCHWLFAATWLYLATFLNNIFLQNLSNIYISCQTLYLFPLLMWHPYPHISLYQTCF